MRPKPAIATRRRRTSRAAASAKPTPPDPVPGEPPATAGAPTGSEIGRRLKRARRAMDRTLQDVADAAGISVSTLSKIENGQVSISYDTLQKVCGALRVALDDVVNPDHRAFGSGRRAITREGEAIRFQSGPYDYAVHASELSQKGMVPLAIRVRARAVEEFDHWSRHDGEEFVYVLDGAIMVHTEIYAPFRLDKGESAYFDSTMAHIYVAVGPGDAQVLSVSYDPHGGRRPVERFLNPAAAAVK